MPAGTATEGRRARQRRELLAEIEAEARRLLEGGVANVSMRAIARGVGMGPASLYTYFDSLDDVFTMLLLSSYERLAGATAAAVAAFAGTPPEDRALAGVLGHRRWALAHRNEFNLIFTDLLPGYAAPPGGPTVAAQTKVFEPVIAALLEAGPSGNGLRRRADTRGDQSTQRRFSGRESPAPPLSEHLLSAEEMLVVVWTAFHGAVTLEVNHHLDWLGDTAALHETVIRRALASIGCPEPSPSVRARFERWADHPGEPAP